MHPSKANNYHPQVWADPHADEFYQHKRERLLKTCANRDQSVIFNIYGNVVKELTAAFVNTEVLGDKVTGKNATSGATLRTATPVNVLDICMAPGGFAKVIMDSYQSAKIYGLSLPADQGGHPLIESEFSGLQDRYEIEYLDITMLAAEFSHADFEPRYLNERPYLHTRFDFVIADGAVLESHKRSEYRTKIVEGVRLRASELVIALHRIKPGGTFVMLLHHMNAWETVEILRDFQAFATVQIKKPTSSHKASSSFYMIAEHVRPADPAAIAFIQKWKATWREITPELAQREVVDQSVDEVAAIKLTLEGLNIHSAQATREEVHEALEVFGPKLVEMGTLVWETQIEGLRLTTSQKVSSVQESRRSTNEAVWGQGGGRGNPRRDEPGHQDDERRGSLKSETSTTATSRSSHDSDKSQAIQGDWNSKKDADLAREAQAKREKEDKRRASAARTQGIMGMPSWRPHGTDNSNKVDTAGLVERAGTAPVKERET